MRTAARGEIPNVQNSAKGRKPRSWAAKYKGPEKVEDPIGEVTYDGENGWKCLLKSLEGGFTNRKKKGKEVALRDGAKCR